MSIALWTNLSIQHLDEKVAQRCADPERVRDYLIDVADTSLHRHEPRWGGSARHREDGVRWLYRQGLKAEHERFLASAPLQTSSPLCGQSVFDFGPADAIDFYFIYQRERSRTNESYTIFSLLTPEEFGGNYLKLP